MSAPHDLAPLLTACFRGVLRASWQGSLAIALVLLARRALGARVPARWHYLLWFLVLARLLVPAVVLPRSRASLENVRVFAQPFEHLPEPGARRVVLEVPDAGLPPRPAFTRPRAAVPSPAPLPDAVRRPWPWEMAAALVWLAGAAASGVWLLGCAVALHRKLRRETFPVEADLQRLWQAGCRRWLRRTPPPIVAADWVDSPALVGGWRPTLLIPRRRADGFTAQDWEHVFAHEIAHLRWRDHWSQWLLLAAGCVHWFNPVVWLGLRRLRADRELAADEWVLARLSGGRALAYGETLLKTLAERPAAAFSLQPGLLGISEDGAQMKQRLRRIAAFLPRRFYGSLAGLAALLCLGSLVLGQGTPGQPSSPTPAPKQAAPPSATPSVQAMATAAEGFAGELLAAARAGDAKRVDSLLNASFTRPPKFSKETGERMIDTLILAGDLPTFTVLHDALARTSYGKDWRISDERLASLVRDKRTDFLDALLSRGLNLDRLTKQAKSADPDIAGWITRRVTEVAKQRADLEALAQAAQAGDLATVQRLIDAGVDVNGVDKGDNTPLIEAVFKNRVEAARLLLDHGAQVDKVRYPGWDYTPLCLCNSVEMAQLLKDRGADLHAKLWRRDVNILVYVAEFAKADLVEWFLRQGADPKMVGDNNENLLFNLKDGRTARLLLEAGVDPNQANKFGATPICSARSAEVAQALIEHGAKVTGFKEPLLPRMIQFGSGGAVEAAIKAGAEHDPEMMQEMLVQAAHMDRDEIVGVLLKYGAKPNEPGIFSSKTDKLLPLQACCIWGGVKTTKVLLAAGADPNGGKAPGVLLKNAMSNGYKEVAKLLRQAGAKGVSDLAFALATHDTGQIKTLLARAPAYAEDPAFWEDALPDAARVGDVDTMRAALAKGVPVEVKPPSPGVADAYTAAAEEGQEEALTILLATRKPGANPEDLRWAMWEAVWNCHPYGNQRSVEHFERCVEMLLAAGAPVAGYENDRDLMTTAVFSRNPGGNPKVMEMLARVGVDPNPVAKAEGKPDKHLLDYVQEACAQGNCSTPVADTLIKLSKLATAAASQPSPSAMPAATPVSQDPGVNPDAAKAPSPAIHKSFVNEGRVSMADGTPLSSNPINAYTHYENGSDSGGAFQPVRDGTFPLMSLPYGSPEETATMTVAVEQRGCAVAFAGPFTRENLDKLGRLEVKLTRGYTASVQIVDEANRPIPGALLRPYHPGPPMVELAETRTDAAGNAVIEHLGEAPLNLRVLADGFQADEATALHLGPAQPYRLVLKATQPLRGTVIATASGKPIAGAVIKLGGVRGPHDEDHYDPKKAPVLTSADGQGHFALASLRPDSRYYLFVEAPGYGGAYVRGVTLAQGELNVTLGPELTIQGKIIHAPPSVMHMDKVYLNYGQGIDIGDNFTGQTSGDLDLQPVNGEANFTVGPFYKVDGEPADPKDPLRSAAKPVELYVDSYGLARFSIDELPVSNFVFDLARKSTTRDAPEADKEPDPANSEGDDATKKEPAPVASPSPTQAGGMAPTPAPKAKAIEIKATAATEDGAPIGFDSAQIHPSMIFGPSGASLEQFFPSFDQEGTSFMRIPSDASDVGIAVTKEGYAAAFAGPFFPPLEEKLKGLHFTLTKGFSAVVQTVDEAGQPIAGARLKCHYSRPLYLDFAEATTDAEGRATLAHVGAGRLDLLVRADGYQADEADTIQLDPAKPYRWTLKKAQPLPGSVVTSAGQPIAGAKVKLAGVRGPYNETNAGAVHAPVWATTDAQGRFVLTSLRPDSRYFFFVDAPGFAGKLLSGVRAAQPELKVVLGPELSVRGKFLHVPAASINAADHTFVFGYEQYFDIEGKFWTVGQQGRVNPKDGEANFTINALYDNAVVIRAEDKEVNLEAKELPKAGLVIDFAPEPPGSSPLPPAASGVVYTLGTPANR